jgi:hypothetical protein
VFSPGQHILHILGFNIKTETKDMATMPFLLDTRPEG